MKIILVMALLMLSVQVKAAPGFTSLTQSDFDKITKEFSSNFAHPSVLGAAPLGEVFGIEAGLVGGINASPGIDEIVKRSAPGSTLPNLYHAGLLGAISVPYGVTGELVLLPKVGGAEGSFQLLSVGGKLTLSDALIPVIPFNLAARFIYTSSEFTFKQTVGAVDGTVTNKNTVMGLQILASPKLPIIEPYLGIGMLKAKNSLGITGTGTIFDSSLTTGQSADSEPSTTQILLGLDCRLGFMALGAE